jgi:glycosyltransferase involved in cell wall biosynthesis
MRTLVLYKDRLISGRGADRATAALLNALAQRGYHLHLITQHRSDEPFSVTLDKAIHCHTIPRAQGGLKGFINKLFLKSPLGERLLRTLFPSCDTVLQTHRHLRRAIEALRPDLILSAGTNETIDLCAEGALPAPLLQLFHIFPLEALKKNKLQRANRFKRALQNHVNAAQVLLPSHHLALRPYTPAPIVTIGNAIETPTVPLLPIEQREKTIIYIAYFSKDKNHLQLIEAFAKATAAQTWRLKLYGTGSPEWTHRLKACAEQHGVADRVDFMGLTQTPHLELSKAAICAYPSLTEGFGMALAEAMWCGCGCIGFKTASGVNELLHDNVTGRLVEPTVEAFAEAINDLILHPQTCQSLGEAAAASIQKKYAPHVIWEAWEALFQTLHHP